MANSAENAPVNKSSAAPAETNPWHSLVELRRDMDRMFEDISAQFLGSRFFPRDLELAPFKGGIEGKLTPAVDVVEKDKEYQVTAEVPGMNEKEIEVTVAGGLLTIKGEKREESEEKKKDYFVSERRYGSFQRALRLPDGVETDKIQATFAKGVLTITLPKKPESVVKEKKIAITGA